MPCSVPAEVIYRSIALAALLLASASSGASPLRAEPTDDERDASNRSFELSSQPWADDASLLRCRDFDQYTASAYEPRLLFAETVGLGVESTPLKDTAERFDANVLSELAFEEGKVQLASYQNSAATEPPPGLKVGAFTVVPYGIIWSDVVYATSRTVPGRFILFIASNEEQGEPAIEVDARRSRVGIDVIGPDLDSLSLQTGGRVEVDFLGNFTTDNQPDTRLRHVYWEAKDDEMRLLFGQTWDIVSPLNPNTINFSILWAAGNLGFRRTQVRYERYIPLNSGTQLTMQGAIAQNVIQDLATGFSSVGVNRESGAWPMIQARSALTFAENLFVEKPTILGVSGHYGETGFDFTTGHPANSALGPEDDVRIETWSFNVEAKVPLSEKLTIQGEFFTGANMSNILGGIVQGVCPCLRKPIRASGGWAELQYSVTPRLHTHLGYGVDDPNDSDSLFGRTKNSAGYVNFLYNLTDNLTTGFEVSSWRTEYHNRTGEPGFNFIEAPTQPGTAIVYDWTMRYAF